jgi:selenide,water dikinase
VKTAGHPRLLVGLDHPDDAGVYLLDNDMLLIQTVDIITPIVDDPYTFGAVAAANALSDIFVMGGRPLTALAILGLPPCGLSPEVSAAILQGGTDRVEAEGGLIIGGHTVEDPEMKYGLAVTGIASRGELVTSAGARPGDRLILTKALGTGIVATAVKAGEATSEQSGAMIAGMLASNGPAAATAKAHGVSAMTDITGFGLLGHASQLAGASGVTLTLRAGAVPLLPGIPDLISLGMVPAGAYRNREHFGKEIAIDPGILPDDLLPLYDPQTSGGILLCIPREFADDCLADLIGRGIAAALVGEVGEARERRLHLLPGRP